MKKTFLCALIALITLPMAMNGQTYSSLWKQADDAGQRDLPQTQRKVLGQIVKKARREANYGQLLKALLTDAKVACTVSPDSLQPAVDQLKAQEQQAKGAALQAVYNAVLAYIYENNSDLADDWQEQAARYKRQAMKHPGELSRTKAADYEPFVKRGADSQLFGDDLLSVIGLETGQTDALHRYYLTTDNLRAQLLTGLDLIRQRPMVRQNLASIDSLIALYGDLTECGEAAIERLRYMRAFDGFTAQQQMEFIEQSLQRWGQWKRADELRNARSELTALQYRAELTHRVALPNREQVVQLRNLRGIGELQMRVYRVKVDGDTNLNPSLSKDYEKLKPLLSPLAELTQTRRFTGRKDYELFDDSLVLGRLPVGVYLVEFESRPATQVSRSLLFVSDVRVLTQALPNKQIRYVAVSATTGQPIKGASLRLKTYGYRSEGSPLTTVTTDEKGEYLFTYKDSRPNEVFATTADDRACPAFNGYGQFSYYEGSLDSEQGDVFTDRSIYRPGQTVHVAAIFYSVKNGYEHSARSGKAVKAGLYDANHKLVAEQSLTTDEYGTAATSFVLPSTGLSGLYYVSVGSKTRYFRVEEYKRPTFVVDIPKPAQDYKAGDVLAVSGTVRSYAGVPVQGARVSYRVERRQAWWWLAYSRYYGMGYIGEQARGTELCSAETVTDADGNFVVSMPLLMPEVSHPLFCNFIVTADVTDAAGETHHGELSLPLGNRQTALTIDVADKVLREDAPKVSFHLRNAAGTDLTGDVRYRIDNGKWLTAKTNSDVVLPKLSSGQHAIEAASGGETVKREFVVFSLDDKRPATETDDWFYCSDTQFPADGKPVTLQVGSSASNVHIIYTLVAGNKLLESGAADVSNELINRKLTYQDEYANGLVLSYVWMRDGVVYHHTTSVRRPLPQKQLQLKWETFRDRLTPGQQEEWTLSVLAPAGAGKAGEWVPAQAQLMATLYDKSLDQLASHDWRLEPYTLLPMPSLRWTYASWGGLSLNGYLMNDQLRVKELEFSQFDHNCYPSMWSRRTRAGIRYARMEKSGMALAVRENAVMASNVAVGALDVAGNDELVEAKATADEAAVTGTDGGEASQQEAQVRENLQETAFFYPQLVADGQGRVSLKFTLPESLTTWRFLGLAHTKDMMHGLLEGEAVAQKQVMIQPNVPRFLRLGDEATISARLFNTTAQPVEGMARLVLLDAESNQPVLDEQAACQLPANGTASVVFKVDAQKARLSQNSLLVCRMTVSGTGFSDGEQHYLPVLPDRELVTVTVPFTQTAPGTKTIDLSALVPADAQQGKLTVEYTNNPAWLMIQALPSVGHAHDNCAVCQAASFYVNSIGRHILRQNPDARRVFEAWKQEKGAETSLMSALEKNEELKELVLSETPWVMDADRESDQKQRLADFFDENVMNLRLSLALEQLKKLQNSDGSWSWWEGMRGSFPMTVAVSEMLVRLNQMAGEQKETRQMLTKAFSFMDSEMAELVKEMKQQEKKGVKPGFPSMKVLEYLYLSALDGRTLPGSAVASQAYLKKLLRKDVKDQTIYEKALTAIVLNSPTYVKSLKEYTVYKEDMGRYYDSPRAGYSWRDYRIPTQVAAIEALQRLSPTDTQTIDEMRRWLLQEKRTQAWDTPLNSVDAIYAFLNGNQQALAAQPKTVLKIDDKPLETSDATAGLGYVKTALPAHDAKALTAEKTSEGTSWGAVYAQFLQRSADVASQGSEVSVRREVVPVGASPLKVGDRVKVRITIEAQRDLDFVEVIDRRAACMEPVSQLSGYRNGCYCTPKDQATHYYYDILSKGRHVIETEYYLDRAGRYETGTCVVQCAYAPEFRGMGKALTIEVK